MKDLGKPMETFIAEKSRVPSCPPIHVTIPPYMRDPPLSQLQLAPAATQTPPHSISSPSSALTSSSTSSASTGAPNPALIPSNVSTVPSPLHATVSPSSSSPQGDNLRWRPLPGRGGGAGGQKSSADAGEDERVVSNLASSALNRSSSALGHLIADVTGAKGGEWDVGVSHTTKDAAEAAKKIKAQTGADTVAHSLGGGGGGGSTSSGSADAHGARNSASSAASHQRSGFSRMLESGIFSHGSLAEIMDEALREINAEEEDKGKPK